jgi:hypothetical protein
MNNNSLDDLPDCPEWTAKQILATLIRNSSLLAGKINFFSYSPEDGPFADANPDSLPRPFVRIHIRPTQSSWFAAGVMKYPMEVVMELGVDGVYDRPLLALWHAVRTSLSDRQMAPGGLKTVLQVKQEARISVSEQELADYAVANLGTGIARFLYGVGYMRCEMLICA